MKILLDSHILLWTLTDDPKLPAKAKEYIIDSTNEIYYSAASIWEFAIKHKNHPELVSLPPQAFIKGCEEAGFSHLPITARHAELTETLVRADDGRRHKDPFDRILIAQAKAEKMLFITHDSLLPAYNESCICWL